MPAVIVLDYGAGNLRSVVRAVERVGYRVQVADQPGALEGVAAVILPGVGAAADTMRNLQARRLVQPLREYIATGRPFLGVCMGLQALLTLSEEGGAHPCLDVVPGRVVRIPPGRKVPHMGWNALRFLRPSSVLDGIPEGSHVYFVHSYYCVPENPAVVTAVADYGVAIPAVVEQGNVVATQFHPEKSGALGLRLYKNFLARALAPGPPG